jgi:hypothetical protein
MEQCLTPEHGDKPSLSIEIEDLPAKHRYHKLLEEDPKPCSSLVNKPNNTVKITVMSDVALCILVKPVRRFGRTLIALMMEANIGKFLRKTTAQCPGIQSSLYASL